MSDSVGEDPAEHPVPSMANPSLLRELPSTPRGIRTRDSLISAARVVFERIGYLDTRLVDITNEARCSSGTFYTYFAGKEEILAAVLDMAQKDMLHPGLPHVRDDDDPVAIIAASNRAYLEAYQRNARLMGVLEQVANIDPEFRRLRHARAEAFVQRNARGIRALQDRGLVDARLDPLLTSRALSSMISRLAFSVFVVEPELGEPTENIDAVSDACTILWANALRLSS